MINIFVTVGTTEFDELIKLVDNVAMNLSGFTIVAQVSSSAVYKPKNISYFEFSNEFENYIENADIIISHAGAGSIYSMLEKGKKLIVVPNLSRIDKHQSELANYVQQNNFSLVCKSLDELEDSILSISEISFNKYEKVDFFGLNIIRNLLK